ncbi:MAG: ATP-dependent helicase HrpB, partial [Paracoccus sp. (in: a-proteobacteria)]|nr:ATP-dependent helicase HrpB [Paracoccus sp. (in: a-proteobacteria)]
VLVFLPGEGEIRRVSAALDIAGAEIMPLYGALGAAAQRGALSPPGKARRIVLATSIAETSLTIPGVRVVVDCGRARRARFDPGSGMSRLVTERVSRAEAAQRRGRAGRIAPGICYRMWARAEEGALPAFAPPEIAIADLAAFALELAAWGAAPGDLALLTPPPEAAFAEARVLLAGLGALDGAGRITEHGRAMAGVPAHPRLAHMLLRAGPDAAPLAALLEDRDPLRGAGSDLSARLAALRDPARAPAEARPSLERIRAEAARLRRIAAKGEASAGPLSPGAMAALAYPDRIAARRPCDAPRYVMSGGRGAALPEGDPLSAAPYLVATDLGGKPREAAIRLALPITEAEIRTVFAGRITAAETVSWSAREGRVKATLTEHLGAITLSERPLENPASDLIARAALEGLRAEGLFWTQKARLLRARIALLEDGPDVSDAALLADGEWLLPYLGTARRRADLRALDLTQPLLALLGWEGQQRLDRLAPAHFVTPLGRRVPIDYDAETPSIELRLQELFGVTRHPKAGRARLRITLLSPGGKPVAVTSDLPGFWAGSYADVRKDMRGRYPRHPWPEDPTEAPPTLRAKPRGT